MNQFLLGGIDGQHLWGFLTAIGTLSLLHEHAMEKKLVPPRLGFQPNGTADLHHSSSKQEITSILLARLKALRRYVASDLRDFSAPKDFSKATYDAVADSTGARSRLDFLSGLACVVGEKAFESSLCAANGAGHQNLFQSMRDILNLVDESHLHLALFEPWQRSYRVSEEKRKALDLGRRKPTLRLDPADERLYALRFSNPTAAEDFTTELGAQALAIPAFALLPVVPGKQPVAVASVRCRQRVTFSWCLWSVAATLPSVRSLVWEGVGRPSEQRERGIFAAYSADRVSGDKGKLSFAPSQGIW